MNWSIINHVLIKKMFTVLDQRKQAKMQLLQDTNQNNEDILNNVRRKDRWHFRNKRKEYLKTKINEIATNSEIKNIKF